MELEGASLREESTRLRSQVERLRGEKQASEEQRGEEAMMLAALREELQTLRDTERRAKDERVASAQVGHCAEKRWNKKRSSESNGCCSTHDFQTYYL